MPLTKGRRTRPWQLPLFHFKELEIMELKHYLGGRGISVRPVGL